MTISEALHKHEAELKGLPNVVHTGIGYKDGKEIILVFVNKKIAEQQLEKKEIIPHNIEGFETDVQLEIKIG
ncbi:MAG TPA: hypothetical protein VGQ09_09245 [Chitinophagaceae bacterium]|jgi:hypothetical protein|nr:hypothetical protein [Chitinophagaceae bacterium]